MMEEYVIPIFLASLFAIVLTFGFFFVRALTRNAVTLYFVLGAIA
jgi:hypothetical protein